MSGMSLKRAFGQISGLTFLSRILGFVRDICFAHFMGAGSAADAFLVAFKLPNLFRRLTAEGALTNAFLPVYTLAKETKGQPAALILAAEVQTALLLALTVIVVGMEIFMPAIIAVLAPGFTATPDRFAAAIDLARITMPYLPMISLVALWAAVLNSADDFIAGAFAPV
ncbi:MAG: lipid II flippase MurJ, partial [Candidatus Puniceispirillaceae bacterium]